jgi:short-subunit dehydrogenase
MTMHAPTIRWALITGASAGIGSAFAFELAKRGYALVLTARREDRLHVLAHDLQARFQTQTLVIALDLSDPNAPKKMFQTTTQAGIAIDMLINNAGYGVPGSLISQAWSRQRDFIQVLMTAPVELCHLYLPVMQERQRGHIINVASLAGHLPGTAGHTLYAAAKAFLIKFSQSLALENRAANIHVSALCPGLTYSEFHDITGARAKVSKMPKWLWMSAERVACEGIDAVCRGDIVYTPGRINRVIQWMNKHLPDRLILKLIARNSARFRVME